MKYILFLLLCISTIALSTNFPFRNKGSSKYSFANYHHDSLEDQTDERAATPPPAWTCSSSYYDADDGCDCACGAPDPDCNNATETVYGCDPGLSCIEGECSHKVPEDWTCPSSFYNNTDGCDCSCGAYDPDCDDKFATIHNCDNFTYPACNNRGECYELDAPPARLALLEEDYYEAKCGTLLDPITIVLLDADFNLVNDTRGQTVTVYASAKASDASVNVTLAGRTSVVIARGKAIFEGLVVLGTAGGEFTLTFTSVPAFIPVSPIFRVRIKPGAPTAIDIKPSLGLLQPNGSLTVPYDTEFKALITIKDECGNTVKNPPSVSCLTLEHTDLTQYDFCDNATYTSNTSVTIKPTELGNYDIFLINPEVNKYVGIYSFIGINVVPQSEYNCFKLEDLSQGVTANDVSNFNNMMISNASYARIRELIFSVDSTRPAVIALNVTHSPRTSQYHAQLPTEYNNWVLASKHFFVEQSAQFLTVISLTLVEVEAAKVNVSLVMPFCGSINPEMQKELIGLWLFAVSDAYAAFVSKATEATAVNVRSTDDVVCSGKYPDYKCCPRSSLESHIGTCAAPEIGAVSIALVVLSIVFAVIAAIYVTTLVAVFAVQNGAVRTHMEDVKSLSEDEYEKKRRMSFLFTVFAPAVAIAGTAQTILLIEAGRSFSGLRILVGIIEGLVILSWYIVSGYTFWKIYVKGEEPGHKVDRAYFVLALAILWLSSFNIFWTFAWVTLGLLLNPERVVAYFVAFLTVFLVAAFKLQSLINFMNTVEIQLQKQLFKKLLAKGTIKDEELEELLAHTIELESSKLRGYLESKDFNQRDVEVVATQIEKYRRFRVKFIIGNVIGTLFFLTSLIIFILLGVEAFRQKSGIVSGVGSVLEGLAGAGAAIKDKMGDSEQQVRELVDQFAKKRGAAVAPSDVPLQVINP